MMMVLQPQLLFAGGSRKLSRAYKLATAGQLTFREPHLHPMSPQQPSVLDDRADALQLPPVELNRPLQNPIVMESARQHNHLQLPAPPSVTTNNQNGRRQRCY